MCKQSLSTLAGVAVTGLAAFFCWPKQNEIRLVSPDGKSKVTITATNEGVRFVMVGAESGEITIEAERQKGPLVKVSTTADGYIASPRLILQQEPDGQEPSTRVIDVP